MGKTRKPRSRYLYKSNPLGAMNIINAAETFSIQEDVIESIRHQLQDSNIEEKLNGLQSLAVLASNKEKVAVICSCDLVRIAAPMLCELDNLPLRNAASGAIRNLSVNGPEVCEFLVEQDVMTPLLSLLNEYICDANWKPSFDVSMRGQIDLRSDVFLQSINLLWNLCESTSDALETFNQTQLLDGLFRCLDFETFGLDIAISVAQCLLVVTENNSKSWNVINCHIPELLCLLEINGDNSHTYLRTLSAGILSNIPALASSYDLAILNALAKTLEINHQAVVGSISTKDLSSNKPQLELVIDGADGETEAAAALRRRREELPTETDIAMRNVGNLLDAQRIAAEVITNMCSPDEENWSDSEEVSDTESVLDYDMAKEDNDTNFYGDRLPIQLVEAIKSKELIEKLWQRAQPLESDISNVLRETCVNLLTKTKHLRISSLLCLQNLCNCLSSDDLGGPNAIYNVWVNLGQQVFKGPQDVSILEPSTSLMRSTLEHLKKNGELFSQMTKSDLELFLNGVKNCSIAEIRANWLRMLGTFGCLLPEPLVKMIVSFIIETCTKEEDVWTISEALDALMDVFADNDWKQIVSELNLVVLIKEIEKIFKNKIKQQRRELKERYPAVQTVRTNLARFVKYVETESLKC